MFLPPTTTKKPWASSPWRRPSLWVRTVCGVLDPCSTLISSNAELADGVLVYPGVLVQCDAGSRNSLGRDCVLYPGTVLIAASGSVISAGPDASSVQEGLRSRPTGQGAGVAGPGVGELGA